MLIKRNVFFSAIDQETGEEKLFSVNEVLTEEEYLERIFSEKKDDKPKMSKLDKLGIWKNKHLLTKKDREAVEEAYDRDSKNFHKLAKQAAKYGAVGGGITGGALGLAGGSKKAAATMGLIGAAAASGGAYAGTRFGGAGVNAVRKHSEKADNAYQKTADQAKVASGKMSEEEYVKRYGKKRDSK